MADNSFLNSRFSMYDLIARKRDGGCLQTEEISFWLRGMLDGSVPDYQTAAMLMAIFWRGLNEAETFALTEEIVASGEQLDLSGIEGVTADKHSTGGVGDKTTLIAMPLAAACGLKIAKMSGRSLGKTGGTADKLAAVPGFKLDLTEAELLAQVADIGLAVVAQNKNLTPADKRLYALRDMTATVDSLPLIAASVMSKKIAAGAGVIVLDVKYGSGAFMPDAASAVELARLMVKLGRSAGRRVTAVISAMASPLGAAVGNALEVAEAAEILQSGQAVRGNEVSADLRRLSVVLAGELLYLGGLAADRAAGWQQAEAALANGLGWQRLLQFLQAQGGDVSALQAGQLVQAEFMLPVLAASSGYLAAADAARVAEIVQFLGAGRERLEDEIDYQVGVRFKQPAGAWVEAGDVLAEIYASSLLRAETAARDLQGILSVLPEPPQIEPLIWGLVDEQGQVLPWAEL